MNILFIQGGSRLKQDINGVWYTDPNFNEDVWKRYVDLGDTFTILLRREKKIYTREYAESNFNKVLTDPRIRIVPLDDVTTPRLNIVNPFVRARIKRVIMNEIEKADKVFIRSTSFYTEIAYRACIRYNKPYLFEVTGLAYEGYAGSGFVGKLIANKMERMSIEMAENAVQATYVTNDALQKRYPCKSGKMIGVSNVQLLSIDETVLEKRLNKISSGTDKIILGTAAFLDVKWKGQDLVIRALAELKQLGITNIEYQLIGLGTGERLLNLAKELNVENQVRILGAYPHDKVFEWFDNLDIYVQSSYQEGLCRSIIEAMSRALPVVCSDIGGNYELVCRDYIFPCGDCKSLSEKIQEIIPDMKAQARINFEHSKDYDKSVIDERRRIFFKSFIEF